MRPLLQAPAGIPKLFVPHPLPSLVDDRVIGLNLRFFHHLGAQGVLLPCARVGVAPMALRVLPVVTLREGAAPSREGAQARIGLRNATTELVHPSENCAKNSVKCADSIRWRPSFEWVALRCNGCSFALALRRARPLSGSRGGMRTLLGHPRSVSCEPPPCAEGHSAWGQEG